MFRSALLIVTTAALLILPAAAGAASPQTILADFTKDQSIDGNYTASELRAANSEYPAAAREYSDSWDIAYRAALRIALLPPSASKGVTRTKPKDTNGNGKIDTVEVQAAVDDTEKKIKKKADSEPAPVEDAPVVEAADEPASDSSDEDEDESSTPWALIAILLAMAVVVGIGIWRSIKARRGGKGGDA